ncbi:MAG: DUF692 domain-containing protein [Moraxellaceae bacterium]|nr:DUF692 domain-containing protein [Moraxellaceae bacterium]MDZ4385722.1 DUF692 domain-containing protein [Moraxellaceae bacterium]
MTYLRTTLTGAGLGLRRSFLPELLSKLSVSGLPDFLEVAPENWLGVGGRHARDLSRLTEALPFVCHGLSLSLGGPAPLDEVLISQTRDFLDRHNVVVYSEHLSYTGDEGHLYDLLPIPMTEEAIAHVVARISRTQDLLGRQIAIENVSTYASPFAEMSEQSFVSEVVKQADCLLLLDVNNVYVNSVNHGFDPKQYISNMPLERIAYLHVAGHFQQSPDLLIDTHGADVCDEVWQLLAYTYKVCGVQPTLLERDFNIPTLDSLLASVGDIQKLQQCEEVKRESA